MNFKTLLLASASGLALISCSPTLKVKQLDEKTGQLPTETKIMPNEVLTEKNINLNDFNQFLFIKKSGVNMEKYESYVTQTLKNIGGFKKIYTQTELEQYVIQNNLTDKVTSISDNIGLLNLQKQVGNFLVCESNVEFLGGYNYQFTFKITNPATAETVLDIKHQAFNWGGLDRPLFNPVFNYYIDWTKKNTK
ncbi:hypothetical protein EG349_17810 [Chryseobacterium shandongense]|jgi:hypothetical protein|uniref:Lipoprotein n=1 Tax=Chryseobacterium shandongense TaxID=1493872 RepID=A0AAD1DN72_9FLAO|nr:MULTISPECIES: hypothetical protein [Chryseobacterium]AZA88491.1 hypothetical protein EG349_17810 [Chryseobacterium shandongense]AZA97033.1 hypothetical protein EG353_16510 [Chryseobacterium shandongense]